MSHHQINRHQPEPIHAPTLVFIQTDGGYEPVNVLARAFCHIACVCAFRQWQIDELREHSFRVEIRPQSAAEVAGLHLAAYARRPASGPRHVDDHA